MLLSPLRGSRTSSSRLFEEQLSFIVNHAQDKVIIVDDSLVPQLEKVLDTLQAVEHFIVIGDGSAGSPPNVIRYAALLAAEDEGFEYPRISGDAAASLCYTSGTTGNPRGFCAVAPRCRGR